MWVSQFGPSKFKGPNVYDDYCLSLLSVISILRCRIVGCRNQFTVCAWFAEFVLHTKRYIYNVVLQTQYEFLQSRASCLFAGSSGISLARIVGPDIGLE